MVKTYSGLINLNANVMCAVDCETSGTRAGWSDIIQIACLPLNSDLRPLEGVRPFYTNIKPKHPERWDSGSAQAHGLKLEDLLNHAPESDRVIDLLVEWFQRLDLPFGKRLAPLAANFSFESGFLQAWLGPELTHELFNFSHTRDVMIIARSMNDRAAFAGESTPFPMVGLKSLCNKLGVVNGNAHDALSDCLATAEVYRAMLRLNLF